MNHVSEINKYMKKKKDDSKFFHKNQDYNKNIIRISLIKIALIFGPNYDLQKVSFND